MKQHQHPSYAPKPQSVAGYVAQRKPSATVAQMKKKFNSYEEALEFVQGIPKGGAKVVQAYLTELHKTHPKGGFDKDDLNWLKAAANETHFAKEGPKKVVVKERKKLSASGWKHIWRGDIGSKGHPTGFHWKGKQDEAINEGVGEKVVGQDNFYKQSVRLKASIGKVNSEIDGKTVTKIDKPDQSTFFPDDWSAEEVIDAIELRNTNDEITTEKGYGISLQKSGDTIYPLLDE